MGYQSFKKWDTSNKKLKIKISLYPANIIQDILSLLFGKSI